MTTEKILTDDVIHNLIVDLGIACDYGIETTPVDNIIPFARAIEKAVLQSLPVQTSSTIRGDSYAGVYIWCGRDNITQHIPKRLAESESNSYGLLKCVASECIRDLEQAMPHYDQVQQWKRDSERLDWLESSKYSHGFCHTGYGEYIYYAHQEDGYKTVREVIDDAMVNQNEDS